MRSKTIVKFIPQLSVFLLLAIFCGLAQPRVRAALLEQAGSSAEGQRTYEHHCAACHGTAGDGNGPAAVWLYPKPRNFSAGLFKIKSTPGMALPTDEDLLASVRRGLPGSSMPSFAYLTEQEQLNVVKHVKFLTARTETSGKRVNLFEEAANSGLAALPVEVPPEPPAGVQELNEGREIYKRLQCAMCHGDTGMGDGIQVPFLRDMTGLPIRPRDFNTELFRGGYTGRDLYLRIHNGLPGTPMIPYGEGFMKPAERWALVHYIQSLRRTDVAVNDLLAPENNTISVGKVAELPTDPLDPAWEKLDPVRVPLNPLWPEPERVYAVAVTALTDGKRLAVLLQWRDDLPQNTTIRVQDFQDCASLQFSLSGNFGFLGMGDKDNPVNLWQWKAGWQAEADGDLPEMRDAYNAMHVDTYFQPERQFATAASAGNVLSQPHSSPVEDANAQGFGSFKSQSIDRQNVAGRGLWHAGSWNVVFIRDLISQEPEDVKFSPGKPVPVAFAIWNGEQGDRNGRKMVSNWYQLHLESTRSRTAKR